MVDSYQKTTDLSALTSPAAQDLVHIVDVSDTTDSAEGTSKKITYEDLVSGPLQDHVDLSNPHSTGMSDLSDFSADSNRITSVADPVSDQDAATKYYVSTVGSRLGIPQGTVLNGKISATVTSNNLTLAIKTLSGGDPSASDPVYVRIGDTVRTISSALSVTANAGTNWCNSGSAELATKEVDYFVYLGYNATDGVVIGFSPVAYARRYADFSATSTNDRYAKISTITNATGTDVYENVGRFAATLSAGAGYTWTVPTYTASNLIQQPTRVSRWLDFTLVLTGSGSMTTTLFSTTRAKYKVIDNLVHVDTAYVVTTGASASNYIYFNAPRSRANSDSNIVVGTGALGDGGALIQSVLHWDGASTTKIGMTKYNAANYALILVSVYGAMGTYEF